MTRPGNPARYRGATNPSTLLPDRRDARQAQLREEVERLELAYYEALAVREEAELSYQRAVGADIASARRAKYWLDLANGSADQASRRWAALTGALRAIQWKANE